MAPFWSHLQLRLGGLQEPVFVRAQPADAPELPGLSWRVQLLNAYYYQREGRNPDTIQKFAPDIPEDRLDRAVFSWGWVGLGLGVALLCLVLGVWPGLIAALAHAVLYVFILAPLINSVGHWRRAYNSGVLAWAPRRASRRLRTCWRSSSTAASLASSRAIASRSAYSVGSGLMVERGR